MTLCLFQVMRHTTKRLSYSTSDDYSNVMQTDRQTDRPVSTLNLVTGAFLLHTVDGAALRDVTSMTSLMADRLTVQNKQWHGCMMAWLCDGVAL